MSPSSSVPLRNINQHQIKNKITHKESITNNQTIAFPEIVTSLTHHKTPIANMSNCLNQQAGIKASIES